LVARPTREPAVVNPIPPDAVDQNLTPLDDQMQRLAREWIGLSKTNVGN